MRGARAVGVGAVTGWIDLGKLRGIRWPEVALRFAMGALISGAAAALAHYLGDRIGGMFLAFPAILPASLTLANEKDGKRAAAAEDAGAVFGVLALFPFAAVVFAWSITAPAYAVPAALIVWGVTAFGLYEVWRRTTKPRRG